MVLPKENGHVLGLVGLEHIKTMFFLFSVILALCVLLGFSPVHAVFDGKNTTHTIISFDLLSGTRRTEH